MKKILLALTGVAAALFLGGSYWIGEEVERGFEAELVRVKQAATLSGLVVEQSSFKRGFFHSLATLDISLPLGPGPGHYHLVTESLLHHGPFLLLAEGVRFGYCAGTTRLALQGLPPATARLLIEALGPYLLTASSRVDFAKQTLTTLRIPEFSLALEEGGRVTFAGLQATITGDLSLQHVQGTVAAGALAVTLAEGELELAPGSLVFDLNRYSEYLHLGKIALQVGKVAVQGGGESVQAGGVEVTSTGTIAEGRLNLAEKISLAEIAAPLPLTSASYLLELNRVDPEAFVVFGRMAAELNEAVLDPAVEFPKFYEGKVRELVSAVLRKGVQCNQRLDFTALGGEVKSSLKVEFVGLPTGVHPLDLKEPDQYLQAVHVALAVTGEERVLMATPVAGLLARYLEQGLIARENQTLVLKATLTDGQLTVGGKSLPLAAFLNDPLAAQK